MSYTHEYIKILLPVLIRITGVALGIFVFGGVTVSFWEALGITGVLISIGHLAVLAIIYWLWYRK